MKVLLIVLLGIFVAPTAFPQAPDPDNLRILTAEQAVDLALTHNLSLQGENLKVLQKEREHSLSWNKLMPTASVSASLIRLNTSPAGTASGLAPVGIPSALGVFEQVKPYSTSYELDPWVVGLSFSAQWSLSMTQIHSMNQTLIDADNARLSREAARNKIVRDVKKTFNQLLALQESLKVTQRQLSNAESRYTQTQASFKAGLVSNVAVLQSQVAFQNLKPVLEGQKLGYKQAMMGFALLLGLEVSSPLTLKGSIDVPETLPPLQADSFISRYLDSRWDVQSLKGTLRVLENAANLQGDQVWPLISLGFSKSPSLGNAFGKSPSTGDPVEIFNPDNWKDSQGSVSLLLRWQLDSLIPGLTAWTAVQGARDQITLARISLEQVRRAAAMEILTLVDQIKKSSTSLDSLNLNIQLAQQSYTQTETAYRAGSQTLVDVQSAELALQTAQYQVLGEKLTLVNGLLDLEYALNIPKDELLQGVGN